MILICTPILLPVILKFAIDPVHFGMILLVNSGIGPITPRRARHSSSAARSASCDGGPVARALAVLRRDVATLLVVAYVPALSLWLSHLPAP